MTHRYICNKKLISASFITRLPHPAAPHHPSSVTTWPAGGKQPHTLYFVCFCVCARYPSLRTIAHIINCHLYKWDVITDACPPLSLSLSLSLLSVVLSLTLSFSFLTFSLPAICVLVLSLWAHVGRGSPYSCWRFCFASSCVPVGVCRQFFEDAFRHCCLCEMFRAAWKVKASHLLTSLCLCLQSAGE